MIGVYFLKQDDEIVYVGQSVNLKERIKSHKYDEAKEFNNHSFIECEKDKLNEVENAYILKHNPVFNIKKFEIKTGSNGMKKMKMLQVEDETHEQAKLQALKKKMSIKAYIKMLVEKDKR